MNDEIKGIVKTYFEARYLKRLKRSGTALLLGNQIKESIPEHSFYVSLFGIILHHLNPKLDLAKLLVMCITHDLEEVRIGDLNQVNRIYHKHDMELKAFEDMWRGSKLGEDLIKIHNERHKYETPEAVASQDCDSLAELVLEKEYFNLGVKEAEEWMVFTKQRLKTKEGKEIAEVISNLRTTGWWEEIKNEIRKNHGIAPIDYEP